MIAYILTPGTLQKVRRLSQQTHSVVELTSHCGRALQEEEKGGQFILPPRQMKFGQIEFQSRTWRRYAAARSASFYGLFRL